MGTCGGSLHNAAQANEGLLLEMDCERCVCDDHVLSWTGLLNLQSFRWLVKSSLEKADGRGPLSAPNLAGMGTLLQTHSLCQGRDPGRLLRPQALALWRWGIAGRGSSR